MEEKKDFFQVIDEICAEDTRYKPDSYEFVMQGLYFTQKKLKKDSHISGRELLDGLRKLAVEEYGPMARTVLQHWGIRGTQDFGNIVFNMINKKILSKTEEDSIDDFKDIYDFESAFGNFFQDGVNKNIS